MKIHTLRMTSMILAGALMAGCAFIDKKEALLPNVIEDDAVRSIAKMQELNRKAVKIPADEKEVTGSFYKTHIHEAIRQLAEQTSVRVDDSYIPSEIFTISRDVNTTLAGFLKEVKSATGVDYRVRNGLVGVYNKDLIEPSLLGKQCKANEKPTVVVNINTPVPPITVLQFFTNSYNMSFVYNTHYIDLLGGGAANLTPAKNTTFNYQGCDYKEAFRTFLRANNLVAEEISKDTYEIRDYQTITVDVPLYFDYKFSSTSGISSSGAGGAGAGGDVVSLEESQKVELNKFLQKYLSPVGKIDVSRRGFVTIEDVPDGVRNAKHILLKEIAKQRPINLKISIVRIDARDSNSIGVDWSAVSKNISAGIGYAASVSGGGSLILDSGTSTPTIINALEQYGKTKLVREYSAQTKSGILNSFKAVEQIPYITTNTTTSQSGVQSNVEAKIAEAGVIINILPTLDGTGEMVDLSTNIIVSELLEMVTFNVNGGEFKLPKLATNEVRIPSKVSMDQTLILTGFKTSSGRVNKEGIPGFVRIPTLGLAFGTTSESENMAEFAVVITPSTIEEL